MTKLSKYFTLEEMTVTSHKNIINTPSPEVTLHLKYLADTLLDVIREYYGFPIFVNSGYRSLELNRRIKGSLTSDHPKGYAADITAGSKEKNKVLWQCIMKLHSVSLIEFDQLIDEKDYTWIHISKRPDNNRNQILHLT